MPSALTLREAFEGRYIPEPMSGCWLWEASVDTWGYGHINNKGRIIRAHRLSYQLHIGEIPKGMGVLHRCDVPSCVNPKHLFLGTDAENSEDKVKKRRHRFGEAVPSARLTVQDVLEIRNATGFHTEIAAGYGVSASHVSHIKSRHKWKSV